MLGRREDARLGERKERARKREQEERETVVERSFRGMNVGLERDTRRN